jgi:hypothetical protein
MGAGLNSSTRHSHPHIQVFFIFTCISYPRHHKSFDKRFVSASFNLIITLLWQELSLWILIGFNADLYPSSGSRILMTKNLEIFQLKFLIKLLFIYPMAIYWELLSYRRSLHPSKEIFFLHFFGSFLPSWIRSGSTFPMRISSQPK